MREQVEQRLRELRAEYERGSGILADLQAQEARCRESLLRISGAVQVLEEILNGDETAESRLEQAS